MNYSWDGLIQELAAAHKEVIEDIKSKFRGLQGDSSLIDDIKAFCAAVDWTEPWIVALLMSQAFVFLSVLFTRKRTAYQAIIFFLSMLMVYNAEALNSIAAVHWQKFARQNYFQPQGLFISVMLSLPLLFTMLVVLINYMIEMTTLLVQMKRKELIHKARQQRGNKGNAFVSNSVREDKKKM